MKRCLLVLMAVLALVFAHFDGISASSSRDNFGSIAYCRATGVYGYAINQVSRADAEGLALRFCRESGGTRCKAEVWFKNNCGALSVSKAYNVYWSYGGNETIARQLALEECSKKETGCKVVYATCNAH